MHKLACRQLGDHLLSAPMVVLVSWSTGNKLWWIMNENKNICIPKNTLANNVRENIGIFCINILTHMFRTNEKTRKSDGFTWGMRFICLEFYLKMWEWQIFKTLPEGMWCYLTCVLTEKHIPDNKVNGVNMGPTWVLSAPDGPHAGPMNFTIRDITKKAILMWMQDITQKCNVFVLLATVL